MRASILGALVLAAAAPAVQAGTLVDVSVEVGGRTVPLYNAVDGSGRLYFEAREGHAYALRLANRSHERLGALVIVDGLNVVSGEGEEIGRGRPGRLYVLSPWEDLEVGGWRTSLDQVRRFTFVDERTSYAARSGKANRRMGWVEIAIYRDRHPARVGGWRRHERPYGAADEDARSDAPAAGAPTARAEGESGESKRSADGGLAAGRPAPTGGHPGTGWGEAEWDPATVVHFDAAPHPAERIVLRYEYARGLRALGVLPQRWPGRDRLGERDRGDGFAKPPRW